MYKYLQFLICKGTRGPIINLCGFSVHFRLRIYRKCFTRVFTCFAKASGLKLTHNKIQVLSEICDEDKCFVAKKTIVK